MLLGRKLLKNSATRYDPKSWRGGIGTCCASSSSDHRHTLTRTVTKYTASASASHATDARRALAHSLAASMRENRSASSATLTASLIAMKT